MLQPIVKIILKNKNTPGLLVLVVAYAVSAAPDLFRYKGY